MYVLEWRIVYAPTRVLFCCLFNKHQTNTRVSVKTIRHSSTYIIVYLFHPHFIMYMITYMYP